MKKKLLKVLELACETQARLNEIEITTETEGYLLFSLRDIDSLITKTENFINQIDEQNG